MGRNKHGLRTTWDEIEASEEGQMHLVGTAMGLGPLGLRAKMCCSEGYRHTESSAPLGMMWGRGVEVKSLPHSLLIIDPDVHSAQAWTPSHAQSSLCARIPRTGLCFRELIYAVYLLNTINHKLADSFMAIN